MVTHFCGVGSDLKFHDAALQVISLERWYHVKEWLSMGPRNAP